MRGQAEFVRQRILIDARGWRDSAEAIASLPVAPRGAVAREACALRLRTLARRDARERIVDPLGLVARGNTGIWWRTRASSAARIASRESPTAALLEEPGRRPSQFDLAEHWERAATEFRDKLPQLLRDVSGRRRVHGLGTLSRPARRGGDSRRRADSDSHPVRRRRRGATVRARARPRDRGFANPRSFRARVLAAAEEIVQRYRAAAALETRRDAMVSPATSVRAADPRGL